MNAIVLSTLLVLTSLSAWGCGSQQDHNSPRLQPEPSGRGQAPGTDPPAPPAQPTKPPRAATPEPGSTPNSPPPGAADCKVGGCSSQLCLEPGQELITTCEMRPEYACYRQARCERQNDGRCAWTDSTELRECLEGAKGQTPTALP